MKVPLHFAWMLGPTFCQLVNWFSVQPLQVKLSVEQISQPNFLLGSLTFLRYCGYGECGKEDYGNPWFLTTHALAEQMRLAGAKRYKVTSFHFLVFYYCYDYFPLLILKWRPSIWLFLFQLFPPSDVKGNLSLLEIFKQMEACPSTGSTFGTVCGCVWFLLGQDPKMLVPFYEPLKGWYPQKDRPISLLFRNMMTPSKDLNVD